MTAPVAERRYASKEEAAYRVGELEHLLAGSVYPPEACARVGWTPSAAEKACYRHGRPDLAQAIHRTRRDREEAAA